MRAEAQHAPYTRSATPEQRAAVLAQAREWAAHGGWQRERGVLLDATGQAVTPVLRSAHVAESTASRAKVKAEENLDFERHAAAIRASVRSAGHPEFLHTHPRDGGSFSPQDIVAATASRFAAIHAIGKGPDGSVWLYTMRPGPKAGKDGLWSRETYKKARIGSRRQAAEDRVFARLNQRILRGELTNTQAETLHWHLVWQQVAREVGPDILRYEAGPLSKARA